jgi:hypothetical protein
MGVKKYEKKEETAEKDNIRKPNFASGSASSSFKFETFR